MWRATQRGRYRSDFGESMVIGSNGSVHGDGSEYS